MTTNTAVTSPTQQKALLDGREADAAAFVQGEAASTQEISTSNSLADLAARINEEHRAVVAAARTTLQHAFNAGEFLLAAKAQVPHGYWGDWLRENCEVSERSAQKYMQLARHRIGSEANPPLTADLTIDEALCSLAKPRPPITIEADYYAVPSADYLPTEAGTVRIGMVDAIGHFEILAVRADPRHPGFFQIAQMEFYGSLDDGGGGSWCEPNGGRPVRADGVREWLQGMMRSPDLFGQVEWHDHPLDRWPFPEPTPRWPSWKKADDAEVQQ